MSADIPTAAEPNRPRRSTLLLAGGVVAAATVAAYWNSFTGPFVFDDIDAIRDNRSIRHLRPLSMPLNPPAGTTCSARPLLNLSFALNYAISGKNVWSYHAFNLAIHGLAALTLLGIVRRTLELPALAGGLGPRAVGVAAAVAAIWAVHPLQTMAVTYIVQRAESLAGLLYLVTLYATLRSATGGRRGRWWYVAATAACLAGVFTKETLATVPLVVLLYDRTFLAGSFSNALRQRRVLYILLAACWVPLGYLVLTASGRGQTAGFVIGISPWHYAFTEAGVILHYLRLTFWPDVLVLDYGWPLADGSGADWAAAAFVLLLLVAAAVTLRRKPAIGFLLAWFFLTLAVTSSFVPIRDPAFEHRMYLALAAVAAGFVAAAHTIIVRWPGWRRPVAVAVMAVACGLGVRTYVRNAAYQNRIGLWMRTVHDRPQNSRGHVGLGLSLISLAYGQSAGSVESGFFRHAADEFRTAIRLDRHSWRARMGLGRALLELGDVEAAAPEIEAAARMSPDSPETLADLGVLRLRQGRPREAVPILKRSLQIQPSQELVHGNLGDALRDSGDVDGAIREYRAALDLNANLYRLCARIGGAMLDKNSPAEAVQWFQHALKIEPRYVNAYVGLAVAMARQGDRLGAVEHLRQALAIAPDFAPASALLSRLTATAPVTRP